MNELKFNSQICTTKEQSERLLKLGLKPETADMKHFFDDRNDYSFFHHWECFPYEWDKESLVDSENIPAWSLNRLIEMLPQKLHFDNYDDTCYYLTIKPFCLTKVLYRQDGGCWMYGSESSNLFDAIIDVIEYVIIGIYFNKEYLKQ